MEMHEERSRERMRRMKDEVRTKERRRRRRRRKTTTTTVSRDGQGTKLCWFEELDETEEFRQASAPLCVDERWRKRPPTALNSRETGIYSRSR